MLRKISQERWAELSQRVSTAKGRLIVLVHPYFIQDAPPRYSEVVSKALLQTRTPVVILEEKSNVGKLESKLRALGAPNHLIIPTQDEAPDVILGPRSTDPQHKELHQALQHAGAREIWVGGMLAEKHHSEVPMQGIEEIKKVLEHEAAWLKGWYATPTKTILSGCVGTTYANLIKSDLFPKVRLLKEALHPQKPSYERE